MGKESSHSQIHTQLPGRFLLTELGHRPGSLCHLAKGRDGLIGQAELQAWPLQSHAWRGILKGNSRSYYQRKGKWIWVARRQPQLRTLGSKTAVGTFQMLMCKVVIWDSP